MHSSRGKLLAEMGRAIASVSVSDQSEFSDVSEPFQSSGSEYVPSDIEEHVHEEVETLEEGENNIHFNNLQDKTDVQSTSTGRPSRGKKRKFPMQNRELRKRFHNTNQQYFSAKGKNVQPKVFDEHFVCKCKRKCTDIVPLAERQKLFSQFWTSGSFAARCALIVACVKVMPKKRVYTKHESKRTFTRKYFLLETEICKKMFLKTLQITQNRIDVALKKKSNSMIIRDERGYKSGGTNKCTDEQVLKIIEHINSFPKYISHYCRKETTSKFLNPDLNLAKMYELYQIFCANTNSVSLSTYKSIFYSKFNLRFKPPKKDTCLTCDTVRAKISSSSETEITALKAKHEAHLQAAETCRTKMTDDLNDSVNDPEVETLTFDLQKTHPIPKLPTGIAYYKRQLNLFNLGIHVGSKNQGRFNVWTENIAGRGTQEVGSCLIKYINEHVRDPVKELRLWSDSCGGQNRSIKLVLLLQHALLNHPTLETITMRFLLSGHSFLPNDSEFGDVESALKLQERLYTDDDYINVMAKCRRKRKFLITRLQKDDFISVENLTKAITNRKVDVVKKKVSWLKCHEIKLLKNQPTTLFMKIDFTQEAQTVNIEKGGKGRKPVLKDIETPTLWPKGKPLSNEKVKDLKEQYKLIPLDVQPFYTFLNDARIAGIEDDVDGFGANELDFEVETGVEDEVENRCEDEIEQGINEEDEKTGL